MRGRRFLLSVACGLAVLVPVAARACPFCSAVSMTFSEEIGNSDAAVIAKMTQRPPAPAPDAGTFGPADAGKAKFDILDVLKGAKHLGDGRKFETVYFGDAPVGTTFLVMGVEPAAISWATPIAITERGQKYIRKAIELPKDGHERLAYFQNFLEDSEEMLSRDAYDEFAKAPYAAVKALKPQMHHDKIVEWIKNPQIPASRRRLYLTMLAVCGTPNDVPMLEEMMRSEDRQTKSGLDALIAAYLTLKGPAGMYLVENLFLKNKDADYTDTYAAIMALRFHGQEESAIPRERLLQGIRYMLDRPQLADLVIPDLARWEDWQSIDKLVALFKNADEESSWVRVPVINFLRACPLPKAKEAVDELSKIDPEVVKRADTLFAFGGALAPTTGAERASKEAAAAKQNAAKAIPTSPPQQQQPATITAPDPAASKPAEKNKSTSSSGSKRAVHLARAVTNTNEQDGDIVPVSRAQVLGALAGSGAVLFAAFMLILRGGHGG